MLLNRLREYIEPINLEIHIYTNGIYIINYTLISNFTDKKIIIEGKKEKFQKRLSVFMSFKPFKLTFNA